MKNDIFIDTSGFYSLLVKKDSMHSPAKKIVHNASKARTRFITTDYIIDESATLLRVKGYSHILPDFFDTLFSSKVCTVEWMDQERFFLTKDFFVKHRDHKWSYTDCFSFVVMKELRLLNSLTKDRHFKEAGFNPMLV